MGAGLRGAPVALLLVGLAYALLLATTTQFTAGADVLTGLPIAGLAAALVVRWPVRTRSIRAARPADGHPYLPWLVFFLVETGWEVFNYIVHGPRSDHPTFSSMTDAVDRYYGLKVLVVLMWLALGWMFLRRGSQAKRA